MKTKIFLILLVFIVALAACKPEVSPTQQIEVSITHDGITKMVTSQIGQNVADVISSAGIELETLDRIEPDLQTLVSAGLNIKIIRVKESFIVEETTLPFESQTIKNESLTSGQTILIQAGQNGIQSITYRIVSEDGVEVSKTITKTEITQSAQPEIIMVGVQSSFRAVEISGVLAYISSANAWVMEANTGNRRALVTSGDLDKRVFSISPDGKWLLYSRKYDGQDSEIINTLWVIALDDINAKPIDLSITNVALFADWVPGKTQTIAYSTVERRDTAPGWQANNDLQIAKFNSTGEITDHKTILGTSPGGIYGWWGTIFLWSPDGSEIAYSRPDSIGLIDSKSGTLNPLAEFTPYATQSDWAWVPGISWADDHKLLFTVLPAPENSNMPEFDLTALLINERMSIDLKQNIGLFANPVISPADALGSSKVAYLSAAIPDKSETSRYSLMVMDRDGSNEKKLYPDEGIQGLDPQQVVWSPSQMGSPELIAFIAQGNLLFINPVTGETNQITGDGSISRIDWK